jgi:hypothetical protein
MPGEEARTPRDSQTAELTYLWTEYKYRHELCWKAIYKLTAAVIALGILPYVDDRVTELLGRRMLVPPALGTLLAVYGVFVINNELRLFAHAKVAHNHLHNQFLESRIIDEEVRKAAIDRLSAKWARCTWFDIYAHALVILLFVISLGNTVFLFYCWMRQRNWCFLWPTILV